MKTHLEQLKEIYTLIESWGDFEIDKEGNSKNYQLRSYLFRKTETQALSINIHWKNSEVFWVSSHNKDVTLDSFVSFGLSSDYGDYLISHEVHNPKDIWEEFKNFLNQQLGYASVAQIILDKEDCDNFLTYDIMPKPKQK